MMWEVRMQGAVLFRFLSLPRIRNLEILGSLLVSHATPQVMTMPDIQVAAILIARSPEVDPEVDPKIGHLVGPAAPLLLATEFILVTGSVVETEVETRTTDLIEDLIILMTMTGTMMTGFITLTAGIMAGVTTGDMMTGVHTGLFPIGLHCLHGLMTITQLI